MSLNLHMSANPGVSPDPRVSLGHGRPLVAIPGPSVIPDRVLNAMHRAMPNIYEGALVELSTGILNEISTIPRTSGHGFIAITNGHGAWDMALSNTLSRGDKVLVLESGRFAIGWGEAATVSGVEVEVLHAPPRRAVDPAAVEERLRADKAHTIKAILVVQIDTASSVFNDIAAIRRAIDAAGHPALYMVDCIASLGCVPYEMDQWGVDVTVGGSQKGLMVPPGLGFNWANDKALAAHQSAGLRSAYWDWTKRMSDGSHYWRYAGTPPISDLYGLREALDMIAEEGLENIWARHRVFGEAIRAAVERDRYAARTSPEGELEAANPAQAYRIRFTSEGLTIRPRGDGFEQAVKLPLTAVLVSPHFLFRMELGPKADGEFRLNDYQLAARLSYFLWLSIPDDTLFELAAKNQLHKPDVLQQQVLRMLKDPKSHAFTRVFVTQWFGLGALGKTVGPDRKKFPTFTPTLQQAMIDEPVLFIDLLFREDRSLLELLDSRETFLNEELARHYGLAGVKGPQMRRVRMTDPHRGGVLGMAGVLTATSLPLRTSPVIRGKWVLETLLGEDQPDPPADVPELAKDAGEKQGKTLREIYALHRAKASCVACHQRMDPIGFGLQNFDAIGRWRDKQRGKPIDATGTLPGGKTFRGPAELKQILLKRKSDLARNLSKKMLSFALGRRLEYFDEPAIRKIQTSLEKGNFKATRLILAVVNSYPFQYQPSRPQAKEPK